MMKRSDDIWQILAIAFLLLVPGLALLLQGAPVPFYNARWPDLPPTVMSAAAAHVVGGFAVFFGGLLVALYCYAVWRRS